MPPSPRAYRTLLVLGFLLGVSIGCGAAPAGGVLIDLTTALPTAERRAVRPVDEAIVVTAAGPPGDAQRAFVMEAPARLTYTLKFPTRARLITALMFVPDAQGPPGAGVTARVGVSDGRVYEGLFLKKMTAEDAAAWTPVDVDLSAYAGWQWSVFYRPGNREWRLILNTDATPGGRLAWARAEVRGGRK